MFNIEDYAKYTQTDVDEERFGGYFINTQELVTLLRGENAEDEDVDMENIREDFEALTGYTLGNKDRFTGLFEIRV